MQDQIQLVYCPGCNKLYPGWEVPSVLADHPIHNSTPGISFEGVYVQNDFITTAEEAVLMKGIDEMPWVASQSGRRKQVSFRKCQKS